MKNRVKTAKDLYELLITYPYLLSGKWEQKLAPYFECDVYKRLVILEWDCDRGDYCDNVLYELNPQEFKCFQRMWDDYHKHHNNNIDGYECHLPEFEFEDFFVLKNPLPILEEKSAKWMLKDILGFTTFECIPWNLRNFLKNILEFEYEEVETTKVERKVKW